MRGPIRECYIEVYIDNQLKLLSLYKHLLITAVKSFITLVPGGGVDGIPDEAVLGHDGADNPSNYRASMDTATDLEGLTRPETSSQKWYATTTWVASLTHKL